MAATKPQSEGSLTYEVMMEDKPQTVHVDHLLPWVDEPKQPNNVTDEDQVTVNAKPCIVDPLNQKRTVRQLIFHT